MKIKVRRATVLDIPKLLEMIRQLASFEKMQDLVMASEQRLKASLFSAQPKAQALLIETEGQLAGFTIYYFTYSTFLAQPGLYVEDIFIKEEFRHQRMGKRIMVELSRIAQRENCTRMEWSVLNWNERAIGFYESLGAKPLNDWTLYRLDEPGIGRLAEEPFL